MAGFGTNIFKGNFLGEKRWTDSTVRNCSVSNVKFSYAYQM